MLKTDAKRRVARWLTEEQLMEVIRRFSLCQHLQPFSRCMACNGLLQNVRKDDVVEGLPLQTITSFSEFFQCHDCGKLYWKGSHYEKMQHLVQRIRSVAC